MALSVTHALQTTVPESTGSGQGTGIIGPTEWNAQHSISGFLDTSVTTVNSTNYTFLPSDNQSYTVFTSTGTMNATIPAGGFPIGAQLTAEQSGLGAVVFIPATGVTFNPPGPRGTAGQYAVVSFIQKFTNVWTCTGSFI